MIVDDNPIDQLITTYILKFNYPKEDIIIMPGAPEALSYLDFHESEPQNLPFLIFLDLDMPGMNGMTFLDHFKKCAEGIKNNCQIIVITASDISEDVETMRKNPLVTRLIPKPLHRHSLCL